MNNKTKLLLGVGAIALAFVILYNKNKEKQEEESPIQEGKESGSSSLNPEIAHLTKEQIGNEYGNEYE